MLVLYVYPSNLGTKMILFFLNYDCCLEGNLTGWAIADGCPNPRGVRRLTGWETADGCANPRNMRARDLICEDVRRFVGRAFRCAGEGINT